MEKYERKGFISYAWGEETSEREAIVNQIDQSLQKRGFKIIRDKRDLGYKGSIRKFMERIGEGDIIIVIISDKYLRSKNCMYELVEIAENQQFADRVFPIILSDAKIYDAADRVDYIAHWDNEKEKLNKKYGALKDKSNTEGILEQLSDYDRFGDEIDGLTRILKGMNTLTPDMHRDSDFSELFIAIKKRVKGLVVKQIQGAKYTSSKKKPQRKNSVKNNKVFIVHGHDNAMKDAVARTAEKIGFNAIVLHEKPNQGKTIIEKFTDYSEVGFAIVLLSPDDLASSVSGGKEYYRARQNVIFELGFFIGKLGRDKVISLYRQADNFEFPSDYSGILFIPFDEKGHWKFDIIKELKALGYDLDANKLLE